jgi:hypothetical protein
LACVATGSTYEAVSGEDVSNIGICHQSSQEQRAIADYLDRETARLNALVPAKERLLELLAEERRALITRAERTPCSPHRRRRNGKTGGQRTVTPMRDIHDPDPRDEKSGARLASCGIAFSVI